MRSVIVGTTASPSTRTLAIIAAVATASLGAFYLLGWALSPTGPSPLTAGSTSATPQTDTRTGVGPDGSTEWQPSLPAPSATAPTLAPVPPVDPHAEAERPQLPAETDAGPFGSRKTTGSTEVALTFDDGPDPTYTPQALALLRAYQVRATFCLVGNNARKYPDLVRAIVADGHTLCNHSWSHDFALGARSRATIVADLVRTNEALRAAVPGARISYFRQPGGNWTPAVVKAARDLGMTSLHWTVDPQDWRLPGAGSIATRVTAGTVAGAIVLLHDAGGNRQGTVAALRSILPNLTRRFALTPLPTGPAPAGRALTPLSTGPAPAGRAVAPRPTGPT